MATVRQTFEWTTIDGRPFVIMEKWLVSLTEQEQQEFQEADKRQKQHRQAAIDNGDMKIDFNGEYIWKDPATAKNNKPTDPVWYSYFDRWQRECGIVLQLKFIEE